MIENQTGKQVFDSLFATIFTRFHRNMPHSVIQYSDNAMVIRSTDLDSPIGKRLQQKGFLYNTMLKGGPGWIVRRRAMDLEGVKQMLEQMEDGSYVSPQPSRKSLTPRKKRSKKFLKVESKLNPIITKLEAPQTNNNNTTSLQIGTPITIKLGGDSYGYVVCCIYSNFDGNISEADIVEAKEIGDNIIQITGDINYSKRISFNFENNTWEVVNNSASKVCIGSLENFLDPNFK